MTHYNFIPKLFNYNSLDIQIIGYFAAFSSFFVSFAHDYLGISAGLFALLFIVMVTDYITGLTAARVEEIRKAKLEDRPPRSIYNSKKGLSWVFRLGSYIVFLSMSVMFNDHIQTKGLDFLTYIAKVAHFYMLIHIFSWELKSVHENFDRIGWHFPIFHLFNLVFGKVKDTLDNMTDFDKNKKR